MEVYYIQFHFMTTQHQRISHADAIREYENRRFRNTQSLADDHEANWPKSAHQMVLLLSIVGGIATLPSVVGPVAFSLMGFHALKRCAE